MNQAKDAQQEAAQGASGLPVAPFCLFLVFVFRIESVLFLWARKTPFGQTGGVFLLAVLVGQAGYFLAFLAFSAFSFDFLAAW